MGHIIHWGIPSDAVMYVQESGRAGRGGELSCATIWKTSTDLTTRYTKQHMIDYCLEKNVPSRRSFFFQDFHDCSFKAREGASAVISARGIVNVEVVMQTLIHFQK